MIGWWRRLLGRPEVPAGFAEQLGPDEQVLAVGELVDGQHVVATTFGIWVPADESARRIGWHWVSKAAWDRRALLLTEARPDGQAGAAVLLAELPLRRLVFTAPGRVPAIVHERVNGSIRSSQHRVISGGGALFVQRKVPGQDGVTLQVRPDPHADREEVRQVAAEVAEQLSRARPAE